MNASLNCPSNRALNHSLFHLMNRESNLIMKPFNESFIAHVLISRLHHHII